MANDKQDSEEKPLPTWLKSGFKKTAPMDFDAVTDSEDGKLPPANQADHLLRAATPCPGSRERQKKVEKLPVEGMFPRPQVSKKRKRETTQDSLSEKRLNSEAKEAILSDLLHENENMEILLALDQTKHLKKFILGNPTRMSELDKVARYMMTEPNILNWLPKSTDTYMQRHKKAAAVMVAKPISKAVVQKQGPQLHAPIPQHHQPTAPPPLLHGTVSGQQPYVYPGSSSYPPQYYHQAVPANDRRYYPAAGSWNNQVQMNPHAHHHEQYQGYLPPQYQPPHQQPSRKQ